MVTIPDRIGVVLVGTDGVPYEIGASSGGVSQQDNTAFTAGTDSGTPVEGIYEATPSTITDGRVGVVGMTASRVLKAALHDAAGSAITTLPVSLASVPSHAVTNAGTFAVQAAGAVAHDSPDSGSPVKIGGYAASSAPTAVSVADRVNGWFGLNGQQVVAAGLSTSNLTGINALGMIDTSGTPRPLAVGMYNGSNYDALRGTAAGGLTVSGSGTAGTAASGVQTVQGIASMTPIQVGDNSGSLTVDAPVGTPVFVRLSDGSSAIATLPVSLASLPALAAGTNGIGKLTANSGVDIGDVDVTSIIPGTGATNLGKAEDAAHTTGDIGVMSLGVRAASPTERSAGPTDGDYEPFATNAVGAVWVTQTPTTVGGLSTFMASGSDGSSILVATKQTIKNSAGQLYGWYVFNPEAATTFVHFYNTDTVTVGTTNPQMTLAIPAGAAANVMGENGIAFSTAISCAATTTAAGNSAPATGVSLVAWYK